MENLHDWSVGMAAARKLLIRLHDHFEVGKRGRRRLFTSNKAEDDAIYRLLIHDIKNLDKYLNQEAEIWVNPVEVNKNGKVLKAKAYFKE